MERILQTPEPGPASAKSSSMPVSTAGPHRTLVISFVLLCLLGLGASVELTRIHVFVHTDPSYHSVCAVSEGLNCETVAISPYSVFAGLPVSVWGILGYLAMGGLAVSSLSKRLHRAWPWGILLLLTVFSAGTSAVLAFISATRIDSVCLFCTATYVINAALLVLAALVGKRLGLGPLVRLARDLQALFTRPLATRAMGLAGVTTLGLLWGFTPCYWSTPGFSDLAGLCSGEDANGHHWLGAKTPKLTIVEFSDYECPHCRGAHKAMRALAAKYADRVRLVHRHLPLDNACHPGLRRPFHPRACAFSEAAECAALQGRFWDMNDALFSIQDTVKSAEVDPVELAVRLGLNRAEFQKCLESHATAERVAVDVKESMALGLNGTPSFIVGRRLFLGGIPEADFEKLLSEHAGQDSEHDEAGQAAGRGRTVTPASSDRGT